VNIQEGCFSGMMFAVGRLVGLSSLFGNKVICEAGFYNAFSYERKVGDWTVVRELIFV